MSRSNEITAFDQALSSISSNMIKHRQHEHEHEHEPEHEDLFLLWVMVLERYN